MGRVFAYEDHNGWQDGMFITDHELSDRERFCPHCELWSELIQEVKTKEELQKILVNHGINKDDENTAAAYDKLSKDYEIFSSPDYKRPIIPKEQLMVGLFFYVKDKFAFAGCPLYEAEEYGDFLVYPESHFDIWDKYETLKYIRNRVEVDYDYYPRGRVVYRKSDDLFIIYYDKCVKDEINRITMEYADYHFRTELDEHYCCHKCNHHYVGLVR